MKTLLLSIFILMLVTMGYLRFQGYRSSSIKPPEFVTGQLLACGPKPNCVCSDCDSAAKHKVDPLKVAAGGDIAAHLINAINSVGGVVTAHQDGVIQATFTSGLFGFIDDVQFIWADASETIDVRSSSRVGYSDLGANRKRTEALRQALKSP